MFKSKKAITLVALIITIIVLLILAGVSINMLLGENGIITKTQSAVNQYKNAQTQENGWINQVENYIDKIIINSSNEPTYCIIYNANDGTNTTTSAIGTTVIVAENSFTAPIGKTFKEWNTKPDGSGTKYEIGSNVSENITLYAQWKKEELLGRVYTVSKDPNGAYVNVLGTNILHYNAMNGSAITINNVVTISYPYKWVLEPYDECNIYYSTSNDLTDKSSWTKLTNLSWLYTTDINYYLAIFDE